MKSIVTIGLLLFFSSSFALHNNEKINGNYKSENARVKLLNIPLHGDDIENLVRTFLLEEIRDGVQSDVVLTHLIESPAGYHLTFDQLHDEIPVYQSQIKVNTDRTPAIRSVLRNDFETANWSSFDENEVDFQLMQNPEFRTFVIQRFHDREYEVTQEYSWAYDFVNQTPMEALKLHLQLVNSHEQFELLITRNKLVYWRDLNVADQGSGNVFNPDPLTTSETVYGSPIIDANDANSAALQSQIVSKPIEITLSGSDYLLENQYVKIVECSDPVVLPPTSLTPDFLFQRNDPEFEAVNALYHIYQYQQYIQSCGFTNLVNYQIEVDVHGLNGADQSIFQPGSQPKLIFGDGGVDDAEDADVVVHEYGHAISYSAAPNSNSGGDRPAIDEGFGDYIAASYSYAVDSFEWYKVFSWDGHNEYWSGRLANTNKTYPNDVVGSIHQTGEIWSSSLMDVFQLLGDTATKILFQSLYSYSAGMTMPNAAQLYLQADTILYGGKYFCDIYPVFLNHGLVDTVPGDPCMFIEVQDSNSIKVLNSSRFAKGTGAAQIFFPIDLGTESRSVKMYNVHGQEVYEHVTTNRIVSISPDSFATGLYIVAIRVNGMEIYEKLVKFKNSK